MSTNDPFANEQWGQQPPPPPRPGMSSTTKVLLVLAIVLGVLLLVCCGGLLLLGFFARDYMGEAMSRDAGVVRQVTERLVPEMTVKIVHIENPIREMPGMHRSGHQKE